MRHQERNRIYKKESNELELKNAVTELKKEYLKMGSTADMSRKKKQSVNLKIVQLNLLTHLYI